MPREGRQGHTAESSIKHLCPSLQNLNFQQPGLFSPVCDAAARALLLVLDSSFSSLGGRCWWPLQPDMVFSHPALLIGVFLGFLCNNGLKVTLHTMQRAQECLGVPHSVHWQELLLLSPLSLAIPCLSPLVDCGSSCPSQAWDRRAWRRKRLSCRSSSWKHRWPDGREGTWAWFVMNTWIV